MVIMAINKISDEEVEKVEELRRVFSKAGLLKRKEMVAAELAAIDELLAVFK